VAHKNFSKTQRSVVTIVMTAVIELALKVQEKSKVREYKTIITR